ncbi:hypothetical protein F4808DRAFT_459967 [Astrocystis sublimbata]|nr:hypothetical protein F4808DRAFT_459967 [Astrocystis sublimbata]
MSGDSLSISPGGQQAILDGPALEPPPGVVSNFADPPNHNAAALAVIIFLLALGTLSASLYAYGRCYVAKQFHFSDLVGLAAYGVFIGFVYANLRVYLHTGFFIHQWDIQLKNISQFQLSYTLGIVLYLYTLMLAKVAILLQWNRIFVPKGVRNTFFWTSCSLIAVITTYSIGASLVIIIPCAPFEAHIDELATCSRGSEILDLLSASINVIVDFAILILPQQVIWKLQMSRQRRRGLSLVFLIGILACFSAIGRTALSTYYFLTPSFHADSTYCLSFAALIPLVEGTFGILVFSVPGIPKAVHALNTSPVVTSIKSWTASSVSSLRSKASRGTLKGSSLERDEKQGWKALS